MAGRLLMLGLVGLVGCGDGSLPPGTTMADMTALFATGCMSGSLDGDETDVDCGGPTCKPCEAGQSCKLARDCSSGFCTNSKCDPASCTDGLKNGTETDVDCGGSCPGCAVGRVCADGSDCASMTCTNGACAALQCMDGRKDGVETDVDCGGGMCPACADGKTCAAGSDCKSGTCTTGMCQSPITCKPGTADCDGNAANGCEVNTMTDRKNCGRCANLCPMQTPTCVGGVCGPVQSVGSFLVEDGAQYVVNKVIPTYSCQEVCAMLFGGAAADYACSTQPGAVDHQAWVSGWGSAMHCAPNGTPVGEGFKKNMDYNCQGMPVIGCSFSAYIYDSCRTDLKTGSRNYCFR